MTDARCDIRKVVYFSAKRFIWRICEREFSLPQYSAFWVISHRQLLWLVRLAAVFETVALAKCISVSPVVLNESSAILG